MAGTGEMKRENIIAAAAGLFWERSYSATSIADIAGAAGIPAGNMFYYFKAKGDIAMAVADIFVAETDALVAEAAAAASDPRQRIRFLLQRLGQSGRSRVEKGCPISAAVRDFRGPAPEASVRAAESFGRLIAFIAAELQKTGMRPSRSLALARAIAAEWQGGIALAHAFSDMTVLAESMRRAEQILQASIAR